MSKQLVKYPNCPCRVRKYQYFRREYRNSTFHLFRQCIECGNVARSPLKQADYDRQWIDSLPLLQNREKNREKNHDDDTFS